MMHGHEKSDPAIVAVKPANNAERSAAESVERRAGTKGNADRQSTHWTQRVTGAGTHGATVCRLDPRWEPYAGKPPVRICAGGREVTRVPTAKLQFVAAHMSPLALLSRSLVRRHVRSWSKLTFPCWWSERRPITRPAAHPFGAGEP
jgi:hypothetical protein